MEIVAEWVQFEIPYLIQVEDSFEKNENARFQPHIDGVPAELQFKKEARNTDDRPGTMFGLVEGDRFGNASYTKVKVGFDRKFLDSLPEEYQIEFEELENGKHAVMTTDLDNREGQIIRGAVEYLNRFLEEYRTALGYYWMRPVKVEEIIFFQRTTVSSQGDHYHHGGMYPGGSLTFGTATLEKEDKHELNARLRNESQIPTTVSLDLDVQNKIDLGEYRLAVITSGTMVEVAVKGGLRAMMKERGMQKDEIEAAFVSGSGDYKGIYTLVTESLPKEFHYDITEKEEFKDWNEKTRKMRNQVVHAGYQPSEREAEEAYNAACGMLELLNEEVKNRLK